jgi:P27 family predicted phage terminase small subunit
VLTKNDLDVLEIYCEAYATWKESTLDLRLNGLTQPTNFGTRQPSPYVAICNSAFIQIKALIVQLGLSPSARARLSPIDTEEGEDDWANL